MAIFNSKLLVYQKVLEALWIDGKSRGIAEVDAGWVTVSLFFIPKILAPNSPKKKCAHFLTCLPTSSCLVHRKLTAAVRFLRRGKIFGNDPLDTIKFIIPATPSNPTSNPTNFRRTRKKNDGGIVSWDHYSIPFPTFFSGKSFKIPWFQSPPTSI